MRYGSPSFGFFCILRLRAVHAPNGCRKVALVITSSWMRSPTSTRALVVAWTLALRRLIRPARHTPVTRIEVSDLLPAECVGQVYATGGRTVSLVRFD